MRQAVAYALPYEQIFKQAAYGRGVPMWGGKCAEPADISWPQPFPYTTDYRQGQGSAGADRLQGRLRSAAVVRPRHRRVGRAGGAADPGRARARSASRRRSTRSPAPTGAPSRWSRRSCRCISTTSAAGSIRPAITSSGPTSRARCSTRRTTTTPRWPSWSTRRCTWRPTIRTYAPKIKRMIAKAFDEVPRIPLWQPYPRQRDAQGCRRLLVLVSTASRTSAC